MQNTIDTRPRAARPPGQVPVHVLIRQRRTQLGLRQADLARGLGCTPEAIGMLEAGRRRIDIDKLPALARLLGLEERAFCLYALGQYRPALHAALTG